MLIFRNSSFVLKILKKKLIIKFKILQVLSYTMVTKNERIQYAEASCICPRP